MANILFVCAGNSVRSQMAEGWARHLGDGNIDVRSAGIWPSRVHPAAIAAMKQAGVDISSHRNRRLDTRQMEWADWVITLCDSVKSCNANLPDDVKYDHWSIPNPDALVNDIISQADAYAKVRDKLKGRIEQFLGSIKEQ